MVQRRNHILLAAIDSVAPEDRQLLQILALLQGGTDFATLQALNPHLPPEPEEVATPVDPGSLASSRTWDRKRRARGEAEYEAASSARAVYLESLAARRNDPAVRTAHAKLEENISDLERRGLLQYDRSGRRYDLHPVVRGVVAGNMDRHETQDFGQKVVDYLSTAAHAPWKQAETLEDVANGMHVVSVKFRMGQFEGAFATLTGDLSDALFFNLDAYAELLTLLAPLFPDGWDAEPVTLPDHSTSLLLNYAAEVIRKINPDRSWGLLERLIVLNVKQSASTSLMAALNNIAHCSSDNNRLAEENRLRSLALSVAEANADDERIFALKLILYKYKAELGDREATERLWSEIQRMDRPNNRAIYRSGEAEAGRAHDLFYRGELTEDILHHALMLAKSSRTRWLVRTLSRLHGELDLICNRAALATESLAEAVRMARDVGDEDPKAEALLALARQRAGEPVDIRGEARRLSKSDGWAALPVAHLWHALGDTKQAVEHAQRAHRWAVADGEPFVRRYALDRSRALLADLGAELPQVPCHDPSNDAYYPWEADVRAFVERLLAERGGIDSMQGWLDKAGIPGTPCEFNLFQANSGVYSTRSH